jgi:hypothetical protein
MNTRINVIGLIIFVLATFSVVIAQYDPNVGLQDRVFLLQGDRQVLLGEDFFGPSRGTVAVVIIPDDVRTEVIVAAWSYAVRYSADGIDLPNYQAAVELMMQRHPTWIAAATKGYTISFDAESAELDFEEPLPEATEESP